MKTNLSPTEPAGKLTGRKLDALEHGSPVNGKERQKGAVFQERALGFVEEFLGHRGEEESEAGKVASHYPARRSGIPRLRSLFSTRGRRW